MKQINLHTIDWKRVLITILTIFVLVLLSLNFAQCENNKTSLANIDALNSQISTYKLKNGQLVSSQKMSILTEKQLKEQIAINKELIKKFSQIKTVTKTVSITKIDSIDVPFEVQVPCVFNRSDSIKTKEYGFSYSVNQNGLKIKNLIIPDSLSIVTGTKRKWFLGKETQTIDITHSNPNIQESAIQHYEIQEPKKWYQTNGAKMGGAIIIFEVLKAIISN